MGPFASLELNGHDDLVATQWTDASDNCRLAKPDQILIPLYSQIRTHFIDVLESTVAFDQMIETIRTNKSQFPIKNKLEWDVYLVDIRQFKQEILLDATIKADQYMDILTKSLPHFMWRIIARHNNKPKIDYLFDATDIRQGRQLVHLIEHDIEFILALKEEFLRLDYKKYAPYSLTKQMIIRVTQ